MSGSHTVLLLICPMVFSVPAAGSPILFADDFDAHPVGASIHDRSPQVGDAWYAPTLDFAVVGSDGGSDHHLNLISLSGSRIPFADAPFTSDQPVVTLSFDWHFSADVDPILSIPEALLYSAVVEDQPPLALGTVLGVVEDGFIASGGLILAKADVTGDYHATMTHFMDTDSVRVTIDDLSTPEPIDGSREYPLDYDITHAYKAVFEMPRGDLGTMSVDNVLVTQVPEPTTLSLLALGGLAVMRRRR